MIFNIKVHSASQIYIFFLIGVRPNTKSFLWVGYSSKTPTTWTKETKNGRGAPVVHTSYSVWMLTLDIYKCCRQLMMEGKSIFTFSILNTEV